MRICVLHPSYEHSSSELGALDPRKDPSSYAPEHEFVSCMIHKATAVRQVQELAGQGFDLSLNLCDGAWDEDRAGIEVVQALERRGLAFTGADSAFYDPSRAAMKLACHYAGVKTPGFLFARDGQDAARAMETLRFPMIVKHPNSYGSIGLTRQSVADNPADLLRRVGDMVDVFGEALVEEFIAGREFTVLVAEPGEDEREPRAYVPFEVSFPPGQSFKHFELKWVNFAELSWSPVEEPALSDELATASRAMFTALRGNGYGRCDLRLNAAGELFMLEINPNCGIFYPPDEFGSADMILSHDPAGHRGFLEHIIDRGIRRQQRARWAFEVSFDPARGYGLYATRDLAAGENVDRYEERAQHLVSREHVERCWDELHRRWFRQYAWPLTDELFVMWGDRPEDWRPVDHSCDPNTWLVGLDLVARRTIRRGEAITMDYATFCGPTLEEFACACGSPLCRGVVRGSDHLEPFVAERYSEHVSDYVRRARGSS